MSGPGGNDHWYFGRTMNQKLTPDEKSDIMRRQRIMDRGDDHMVNEAIRKRLRTMVMVMVMLGLGGCTQICHIDRPASYCKTLTPIGWL